MDSPRALIKLEFSPLTPLVCLLLLIFPLYANDFFLVQIVAQGAILGLIALSLLMLAGWGGMVSLSQMTIAGLSGYLVAILGTDSAALSLGLPWWLVLPLAVAGATLFAALIGFISVRTLGIYTIMITLAIGVAFYYFTNQNYHIFNGFTGFAGIKPPPLFDLDWRAPLPFYYLSVGVAALGYLLVLQLERSPFGLALKAISENPRRMAAIGFDVTRGRLLAHVCAGFIAAIGGVLLVWYHGRISPGSVSVGPLLDILIIAVIGGMKHPSGPFIGALAFLLIKTFAIDLIDRERFNTLIGLFFLSVVLFSPDGLLGLWQRLANVWRRPAPSLDAQRTSVSASPLDAQQVGVLSSPLDAQQVGVSSLETPDRSTNR